MALTAIQVQKAKLKEKPYKLSDERGLYLLVNPTGDLPPIKRTPH